MFVALPVHGGIGSLTMNTIIGVLARFGGTISVIADCPWIDHARSELVGRFLESNENELLFIDADISFDPIVAGTMHAADSDVIVTSYRRRNPPFQWTTHTLDHSNQIKDSPMRTIGNSHVRIIEIESDGLGCCLIQRHVLERLLKEYREFDYISEEGKGRCNLFTYGIRESNGKRRLIGEDEAFFERVRSCGFKVECLVDGAVQHGSISASLAVEFPPAVQN